MKAEKKRPLGTPLEYAAIGFKLWAPFGSQEGTGTDQVLALSASAQTQQCPQGYHYDSNQQKCVKHGD